MSLTRRPARDGDSDFLFSVFAETRRADFEALGLDRATLEPLLRMQFEAQDRSYRAAHPRATFELILIDGTPAGRLYVDRTGAAIELLEISLLSPHRSHGIGSTLLGELLQEARAGDRPVRLHVARGSAAVRLYERLGFATVGGDEVYARLEYSPVAAAEASQREDQEKIA